MVKSCYQWIMSVSSEKVAQWLSLVIVVSLSRCFLEQETSSLALLSTG